MLCRWSLPERALGDPKGSLPTGGLFCKDLFIINIKNMFCVSCGTKIKDEAKFCYHCGMNIDNSLLILKKEKQAGQNSEVKKDIKSDNSRETAGEYLAKTDIKSKDEARRYLNQLKALFWIIFLGIFVLGESDILAILYFGLFVYFIVFCLKLLNAEKLSKANAFWCIFFAPISWLHLYPLMANPLKIILGEKQPPIHLSNKEREQKATEFHKKIWREFWMALKIVIGILTVILIAMYLLFIVI